MCVVWIATVLSCCTNVKLRILCCVCTRNACTLFALLFHGVGNHLYLALGYCIANSKCSWELELYGTNDISSGMFLQRLDESKAPSAYTIKRVHCYGGTQRFGDRLFTPNTPKQFIEHIESLSVIGLLFQSLGNYTTLISQLSNLHTLSLVGIFSIEKFNTDLIEFIRILYKVPCLRHLSLHKLRQRGIDVLYQ